ncbi:hypothetical protein PHLGIDRAFT_118145 [Phlebiopsis gigantea 11061_1 CR5-6]|uniref:NAD(P)-binding protein n=1 Tax=Phlebiopsis gigantea (strain 11061_1 CR5-6) TaxID=745531 RepID=A0A0C3RYU5_PHLG1|nr:hypothetical protein PHLGIDRAFT_118145 [Phlebiopsis gigantea 11061_1 CR5-6]
MSPQLVWLITGTSSGFGEALTKVALARGDRVIATARSVEKIKHLEGPTCKTLQLDVTHDFDRIQAVAKEAVASWGRVDVLVNNAGVGAPGLTEEAGAAGYQKAFATNLFGAINVTNAFIPYMRDAKSGTIVLVGSRHAWRSQVPLMGSYASSKAALHAWGEALSAEVKIFGIRVLIVQPGAHRTDMVSNAEANPISSKSLPFYDGMKKAVTAIYKGMDGKQPNDASKAMTAVVDVVRGEGLAEGKTMPLWLVLGQDAEDDLRENFRVRLQNLDEWKDVTRSVLIVSGEAVHL